MRESWGGPSGECRWREDSAGEGEGSGLWRGEEVELGPAACELWVAEWGSE